MQSSFSSPVPKLAEWLLWATLGLSTLVILPVFLDFMISTKVLFILVGALLLGGLFLYHSGLKKNISFMNHSLTLPLALFGLAGGLSTFLTGPYPVENLLGWGGLYLSFVVIALVGGSLLPKDSVQRFTPVITTLTLVLAVSSLLQVAGFGPSRLLNAIFGIDLPHTGIFNLIGSPFIAAQFFGVTLVTLAVSGFYRKSFASLDIAGMAGALVGLLLSLYLVMPGKEATPLILPFGASWSIALNALHNFRVALVGLGPEHYGAAYTQFRPGWINGQAWWSVLFTQASNVPLTLVVTTGFLGLISWLLFLVRVMMEGLRKDTLVNPAAVMVVAIAILQLLLPATAVLFLVQAVALAVWFASERSADNVFTIHFLQVRMVNPSGRPSTLGKLVGIGLVTLLIGTGLYYIGRAYAASYTFYKGSVALAQNDAVNGYTQQQRAVIFNSYNSSFRSEYALTNLGIALALSNKTDLSEEEQTQVTQLIQQSIREARAATVLRPDLASNWQILARVYRNLIGSAEGADQWTVTSYVSAIERSPSDPLLRLELGQVFFQLKQYNEALNLFNQAAELKPDLANAYYNGANTLKELGELKAAEQAYQRTLQLLAADSEEYVKVTQELETLQAEIAKLPKEGEADEENAQEKTVPSITEQNLLESANDTVTEPSTQNLDVNQHVSPSTATNSGDLSN